MTIRDIYETGFDEDVQTNTSANQRPECNGHVTTNNKETVCEDCGFVIEEQRLDHGTEWRAYDEEERECTGASLIQPCRERLVIMPRCRTVMQFSPLYTGKYRTGKLSSVTA